MGRVLKYLFILILIGIVALVAYTYAAPLFGVDFTPDQGEVRKPVVLDAK